MLLPPFESTNIDTKLDGETPTIVFPANTPVAVTGVGNKI
jgi:hypothetical protein